MCVLAAGLAGDSGDKLSRGPCKERGEGRASGTLIDNGVACLQNPAKALWPKHFGQSTQPLYIRMGFLFMGQISAEETQRPMFTSSSPITTHPRYKL